MNAEVIPVGLVMSLLALLVFLGGSVHALVALLRFKWGCAEYLKRAADAGTAENALLNLDHALDYLEQHGLISGSTSMFVPSPQEDIGYWYRNLLAAREELRQLPANAPQPHVSSLLVRVREVVTDGGGDGREVTVPAGLATHPHNLTYAIVLTLSFVTAVFSPIALR